MSLPDLPWTGITWALAALLVVLLGLQWRARRRRPEPWYDRPPAPVPVHAPEQQVLLQAVNEVRSALDRHDRQMGELRTFWSQRLDALDGRIGALVPAQPRTWESEQDRRPGLEHGDFAAPQDSAQYGAESLGRLPAVAEPAWSPRPGDRPVEIRDGVLVVSRSLPPAGYVSATGSGQAQVYLNADVQLTEFSLPKWAAFFELQGAKPYAAYRTRRPAEVRWDEGAGCGELISKGTAEAI